MARTNTEVVSNLPVYTVKPSTDFPGWLVVICPYEDCGDIFLVRKSRWTASKKRTTREGREYQITGRSCPYCFRVGLIPGQAR